MKLKDNEGKIYTKLDSVTRSQITYSATLDHVTGNNTKYTIATLINIDTSLQLDYPSGSLTALILHGESPNNVNYTKPGWIHKCLYLNVDNNKEIYNNIGFDEYEPSGGGTYKILILVTQYLEKQ